MRCSLSRLQGAKLCVNAAKSIFGSDEVEYLGYVLTHDGIRPQRKKVDAILAIEPPRNVKDLRKFLGMVQYYRDVWEKRSHLLVDEQGNYFGVVTKSRLLQTLDKG